MLQRQLSHLTGRNLDRRQFKPLIFSVSGFMSPAGLGPENDYSGEAQQQL
jgi:hypothetical protein